MQKNMNTVSVRACTMKKFWVPTNQKQLKAIVQMKKFVPSYKKHSSHHQLMN